MDMAVRSISKKRQRKRHCEHRGNTERQQGRENNVRRKRESTQREAGTENTLCRPSSPPPAPAAHPGSKRRPPGPRPAWRHIGDQINVSLVPTSHPSLFRTALNKLTCLHAGGTEVIKPLPNRPACHLVGTAMSLSRTALNRRSNHYLTCLHPIVLVARREEDCNYPAEKGGGWSTGQRRLFSP